VRSPYADLLSAGTHGTTYGGSPLACAVALKVLEIIALEKLETNARNTGDFLKSSLQLLAKKYPGVIQNVRGLGMMIGVELAAAIPNLPGDTTKASSVRLTNLLHAAGVLVIPAGANILRLLPALNLTRGEAEEGLKIIESVVAKLAA
jgi:acetylornithine/succinyldiaminopimelate/putrescine aminotransferase